MSLPIKVVCCVCTKQRNGDDWKEEPIKHNYDYSHGYCPDCYVDAMEEVNRYIKQNRLNKNQNTK